MEASSPKKQEGDEKITDVDIGIMEASFERDKMVQFKKLPTTISDILNPDILSAPERVAQPTTNKADRNDTLDLMISVITSITSISREMQPTVLYETFNSIMPTLPPVHSPELKKIPTDPRIKSMDINPEYIVNSILTHMKSFSIFEKFDVDLIPSKIKQDLLESNREYSYNNVYVTNFYDFEQTMALFTEWTTGSNRSKWEGEFRIKLQERFDDYSGLIEKSILFLKAMLAFYIYSVRYYLELRHSDLVDYWKLFSIEDRQRDRILPPVNKGAQEFVYKYADTVEQYNSLRIIDAPVRSDPRQKNRRQKVMQVYYVYILSALIQQFKKISAESIVSRELKIKTNMRGDMQGWLSRTKNIVEDIAAGIQLEQCPQLADLYEEVLSAVRYITMDNTSQTSP